MTSRSKKALCKTGLGFEDQQEQLYPLLAHAAMRLVKKVVSFLS